METTSTPPLDNTTPPQASHGHLHTGRRLRKLLRPNGRRVHIAGTPEEYVHLTRTLPNIEPDDNFDCYLQGSTEHLEAVREIHAFHENRSHDLRTQHGSIYEEFELVRSELDTLADELLHLSNHGVALDANFSKFGYDAHIRTKDSDSSTSSLSGDLSSSHRDWEAERRKGQALKFWKKPIVRQYWHRGLLWRASEVEEVASFELFVDLLYVGIISVIGDTAAENATGFNLLKFTVTFALAFKMWTDLTLLVSWFETNDIFQRILVLFLMICLFGFTLNIAQSFETTWIPLIAFYLAQRLFHAVHFLWIGYLLPMVRVYMIINAICTAIPAAVWVASVQVEYPDRLALVWIAIVLDLFGVLCVVFLRRWAEVKHSSWVANHPKYFDFLPAINIEHKTERTNAFVTLVFGYSVVALLFQNKAAYGINAFFGKAVLGLIQAFSFNWLYFEIDSWNLHTHAIRRHFMTSIIWTTIHFPFIMAYVLAGASLSRLVLATDCHDANVDDLTDAYTASSKSELSSGLRWFYCAGLGVALLSMSIISLCHVHKEFDGERIGKRYRISLRVSVAIILIFLPLADSLSSLKLVSITTGLIVLTLMIDVYGSTSIHDDFWKCTTQCRYRANCHIKKKLAMDAVKKGATIRLDEVRLEIGREKAYYDQV
ncbi:hypothetical protein HO173_011435 [Letharia columbiana]|uniref:Uncharacterized protein n=1 Tax=Letharia columbiana TaxID=112416 RepID=A0A8H6FJC0_9LECA|nr:uncharacterized protein HO173_011435 [Letharia columbiana]KAF6229580.1 hypothetical protein HO173_011435 [Letharia columbiana]